MRRRAAPTTMRVATTAAVPPAVASAQAPASAKPKPSLCERGVNDKHRNPISMATRHSFALPLALALASLAGAAAPASAALPGDNGLIAFANERNGNRDIYTMAGDGSGVTRLTNGAKDDGDPAWSPDGTRLAFVSSRDGNPEIYTMAGDGSGQI